MTKSVVRSTEIIFQELNYGFANADPSFMLMLYFRYTLYPWPCLTIWRGLRIMENSGITESNTVEDGTATVDNQLIINNNKSSEETEPEPGLDNVSAVNQRNAALGSSQDSEPSSEEVTASSSEAGDRAATSEASGKGEEGGAPGTEEVSSFQFLMSF